MSLPIGLFAVLYRVLCLDTLLKVVPATFRFAFAWLFSRRYRRLIPGLIPLAAGLVVLTAIFAGRIPGHNQQLLQTYLTQARESVKNQDLAAARLNFRRALQLSSGSHDVRYEFAVALFEMDQRNEAYRMLAGMAPLKKTGYLPAHRFLSQHFESDKSGITAIVRTLHLSHIVRQSRDNRDDRRRLFAQLIQLRQLDAAEKLLRETLDDFPEDRLLLVELKSATGDQRTAASEAATAIRQLRLRLQQSPADIHCRLQLAQAFQYAGQFAQAIMVLEQGLQQSPDNRLIDAIAAKCGHWMSLLPPASRKAQFQCLQQIANAEPAEITGDITVNQFFMQVFQSDQRDVLLQFLIGTVNASEGRIDDAEASLRNALQLSEGNPVVQNNLACVLLEQSRSQQTDPTAQTTAHLDKSVETASPSIAANTEQPLPVSDKLLSEALQLINNAIQQSDSIGEFYDTKAQILVMTARHAEATQQWQRCLSLGLNDARIHRQLAKHLNILGRTDEAIHHSQLAEQLGAANSP